MKIGKLYQVKKFYWFIYPSTDIAADASDGTDGASDATNIAAYYSNKYNCKVSYIEPNSIFVFLEQDGYCCKILTTNGELGWINLADWCKADIEEVNQ